MLSGTRASTDHLIDVEGESLRRAVVRGSLERLNPVMMTALTAGLALDMVVVPALYFRWGLARTEDDASAA